MLLECVPNISEGRDEVIINEIISSMKGIEVKNVHMDPDHNRTVLTFFGEPKQVINAAFLMARSAMQLLDIHEHVGVHPYIGVVDVIPLIPFRDAGMKDAIEAAYNLGEKLWGELSLPVYYYGDAAKIKERKDLPNVRRGGYASLQRGIDLPERKPDVGIGLNKTAGAVAVGARDFLIAFNVNINTSDLSIAQSIARNIREKSGGLKGVRALGLLLESRSISQVSVNVVDHKETSLKKVFDEVEKWVKEYGANVLESEIVGMLPKSCYYDGLEKGLNIKNFSKDLLIPI